jgi:hypothetical protein
MYKIFYKNVLSNLLVGKRFEDYKDKKIFNKFELFAINFDYTQRIYDDSNSQSNTCIVAVKDGIIKKVIDISLKN